MFKTLIIEPDDSLTDLLKANLESEFKAEVTIAKNYKSAIDAINTKHLDIILVRSNIKEENLAIKVLCFLGEKEIKTPVITLGPVEVEALDYIELDSTPSVSDIIDKLIETLKIPEGELEKVRLPQYIGFPLHHFFQMSRFVSDIYIKLKKRGDFEFVKRINAGDDFDKKMLLKYKESGLNELYIEKEYRHKFWDVLVGDNLKRINDLTKDQSNYATDKFVELSDDSYKLSAELLGSLGINEQTVKIASGAMDVMSKSVKSMDKLGPLLRKLMSNEGSYGYKRAHLITLFSYEVISRLDWFGKEQIDETFEKIVFCSFMHDVVLADEKLLRVNSKIDLYKVELDDKSKSLIQNHANIVSSLVQKFPRAPRDADIIIKQHHGTTNGIGFADQPNASLSKLSIIIIILERFVIRILDFNKEKDTMKSILDDLKQDYQIPSYKKVMDALTDTILNQVS
ncbi:MAG: hypothetical protein KC493_16880 [Bacteriovoracaceae bacterium]|nr:hypothetical protein [Bacteriovoracaceae bacterium]